MSLQTLNYDIHVEQGVTEYLHVADDMLCGLGGMGREMIEFYLTLLKASGKVATCINGIMVVLTIFSFINKLSLFYLGKQCTADLYWVKYEVL